MDLRLQEKINRIQVNKKWSHKNIFAELYASLKNFQTHQSLKS